MRPIDNPVYEVDGVIHYAVDNNPAMYPITVSKILSESSGLLLMTLLKENLIALKDAVVLERVILFMRI